MITNAQLEEYISQDVPPFLEFGNFPCHTQAVERNVKLVTEASLSVCDEERDGVVRATLEARRVMGKFNTKKDYKFGYTAE